MSAGDNIDKYIAGYSDWRGVTLAKLRKLVLAANPEIAEDWKWDCPVFTKGANLCALCALKDHVKINFFKGAQIADPKKVFNNGLEAKNTRSIDFFVNDSVDEEKLTELIKAAVALNS